MNAHTHTHTFMRARATRKRGCAAAAAARVRAQACHNNAASRNRIAYKRGRIRSVPPRYKSWYATVTYIRGECDAHIRTKKRTHTYAQVSTDASRQGEGDGGAVVVTTSMTSNIGRQGHAVANDFTLPRGCRPLTRALFFPVSLCGVRSFFSFSLVSFFSFFRYDA